MHWRFVVSGACGYLSGPFPLCSCNVVDNAPPRRRRTSTVILGKDVCVMHVVVRHRQIEPVKRSGSVVQTGASKRYFSMPATCASEGSGIFQLTTWLASGMSFHTFDRLHCSSLMSAVLVKPTFHMHLACVQPFVRSNVFF